VVAVVDPGLVGPAGAGKDAGLAVDERHAGVAAGEQECQPDAEEAGADDGEVVRIVQALGSSRDGRQSMSTMFSMCSRVPPVSSRT
jgi:hypothetical protein